MNWDLHAVNLVGQSKAHLSCFQESSSKRLLASDDALGGHVCVRGASHTHCMCD